MPRKKILLPVLTILLSLLFFYDPRLSYAANSCQLTPDPPQVPKNFGKDTSKDFLNINIDATSQSICSFKSTTSYAVTDSSYKSISYTNSGNYSAHDVFFVSTTQLSFVPDGNNMPDNTTKIFFVCESRSGQAIDSYCKPGNNYYIGQFSVNVGGDKAPTTYTLPKLDPAKQTTCGFQTKSDVTLHITDLTPGKNYQWWEKDTDWGGDITVPSGSTETDFPIKGVQGNGGPFDTPGTKTVCVDIKEDGHDKVTRPENCISLDFEEITPNDTSCGAPTVLQTDPPCALEIDQNGCTKINTAFGVITTSPQAFIAAMFAVFLSLSGGIALLMIIRSGYQLLTSQGNAEKVKEAQDRITSAVVGLLFAIFALVILEVIGVDILHIPGIGH